MAGYAGHIVEALAGGLLRSQFCIYVARFARSSAYTQLATLAVFHIPGLLVYAQLPTAQWFKSIL